MVKAGKGATLVLRIHHCYADGAALVRLLQAITDGSAAGSAAAAVATEPLAPEAEVGVLDELARLFTDAERAVGTAAGRRQWPGAADGRAWPTSRSRSTRGGAPYGHARRDADP